MAKYINTDTLEYPLTEKYIRDFFPTTSLSVLTPFVPPKPFAEVIEVDRPIFDPTAQSLSEGVPTQTDGVWSQTWVLSTLDKQSADGALAAKRAEFIQQIDSDVDAIYGQVVGNRAEEYRLAEDQATAFIAANYTGTVPSSVKSWADAKGWTAEMAANDIAQTAAQWRYAQALIRSNRLQRKEQLRTAIDFNAVNTVMAFWNGFLGAVKGQLGVS